MADPEIPFPRTRGLNAAPISVGVGNTTSYAGKGVAKYNW
jgi:hypothetical protein